jgi:hypothetical protein
MRSGEVQEQEMSGGECVHASNSFSYRRGWICKSRKQVDRKFSCFFITGAASLQLPRDSLSWTNLKLPSDNLYGTEGVVT